MDNHFFLFMFVSYIVGTICGFIASKGIFEYILRKGYNLKKIRKTSLIIMIATILMLLLSFIIAEETDLKIFEGSANTLFFVLQGALIFILSLVLLLITYVDIHNKKIK